MSAFYNKMANVALRQIAKFGQTIVVVRESAPNHDPITGNVAPGDELRGNLPALVLPASKGTIEAFDNRVTAQDTLIDEKLRFVVAAAKGAPFEPKGGDALEFGGKRWHVMGCTPVAPNGTALIFRMGVRLT